VKRSNGLMLLCGLVAATVAMAWCVEAKAYPPVVVWRAPVVIRSYPLYPPTVVRSYPQSPVYYRQPVVVDTVAANPAPQPIQVTVVNPEATGVTLSFTVRGTRYVLSPGAQQDLFLSGPRIVEFDRGGSFGVGRRLLTDGSYAFAATDLGWTLRRLPQ
jgi:hypothetical protein